MRAFIGLGSNLQQPIQQVQTALLELAKLPDSRLLQQSCLYRSPPMGPQDQPDYINAVAELDTRLSAWQLLDALQQIELNHGRQRQRHWGERTLDLDILLYGDAEIRDQRLLVPHPGIAERAFVLYPLLEIAPDLQIPGLGPLDALCQACERNGLQQLDSTRS